MAATPKTPDDLKQSLRDNLSDPSWASLDEMKAIDNKAESAVEPYSWWKFPQRNRQDLMQDRITEQLFRANWINVNQPGDVSGDPNQKRVTLTARLGAQNITDFSGNAFKTVLEQAIRTWNPVPPPGQPGPAPAVNPDLYNAAVGFLNSKKPFIPSPDTLTPAEQQTFIANLIRNNIHTLDQATHEELKNTVLDVINHMNGQPIPPNAPLRFFALLKFIQDRQNAYPFDPPLNASSAAVLEQTADTLASAYGAALKVPNLTRNTLGSLATILDKTRKVLKRDLLLNPPKTGIGPPSPSKLRTKLDELKIDPADPIIQAELKANADKLAEIEQELDFLQEKLTEADPAYTTQKMGSETDDQRAIRLDYAKSARARLSHRIDDPAGGAPIQLDLERQAGISQAVATAIAEEKPDAANIAAAAMNDLITEITAAPRNIPITEELCAILGRIAGLESARVFHGPAPVAPATHESMAYGRAKAAARYIFDRVNLGEPLKKAISPTIESAAAREADTFQAANPAYVLPALGVETTAVRAAFTTPPKPALVSAKTEIAYSLHRLVDAREDAKKDFQTRMERVAYAHAAFHLLSRPLPNPVGAGPNVVLSPNTQLLASEAAAAAKNAKAPTIRGMDSVEAVAAAAVAHFSQTLPAAAIDPTVAKVIGKIAGEEVAKIYKAGGGNERTRAFAAALAACTSIYNATYPGGVAPVPPMQAPATIALDPTTSAAAATAAAAAAAAAPAMPAPLSPETMAIGKLFSKPLTPTPGFADIVVGEYNQALDDATEELDKDLAAQNQERTRMKNWMEFAHPYYPTFVPKGKKRSTYIEPDDQKNKPLKKGEYTTYFGTKIKVTTDAKGNPSVQGQALSARSAKETLVALLRCSTSPNITINRAGSPEALENFIKAIVGPPAAMKEIVIPDYDETLDDPRGKDTPQAAKIMAELADSFFGKGRYERIDQMITEHNKMVKAKSNQKTTQGKLPDPGSGRAPSPSEILTARADADRYATNAATAAAAANTAHGLLNTPPVAIPPPVSLQDITADTGFANAALTNIDNEIARLHALIGIPPGTPLTQPFRQFEAELDAVMQQRAVLQNQLNAALADPIVPAGPGGIPPAVIRANALAISAAAQADAARESKLADDARIATYNARNNIPLAQQEAQNARNRATAAQQARQRVDAIQQAVAARAGLVLAARAAAEAYVGTAQGHANTAQAARDAALAAETKALNDLRQAEASIQTIVNVNIGDNTRGEVKKWGDAKAILEPEHKTFLAERKGIINEIKTADDLALPLPILNLTSGPEVSELATALTAAEGIFQRAADQKTALPNARAKGDNALNSIQVLLARAQALSNALAPRPPTIAAIDALVAQLQVLVGNPLTDIAAQNAPTAGSAVNYAEEAEREAKAAGRVLDAAPAAVQAAVRRVVNATAAVRARIEQAKNEAHHHIHVQGHKTTGNATAATSHLREIKAELKGIGSRELELLNLLDQANAFYAETFDLDGNPPPKELKELRKEIHDVIENIQEAEKLASVEEKKASDAKLEFDPPGGLLAIPANAITGLHYNQATAAQKRAEDARKLTKQYKDEAKEEAKSLSRPHGRVAKLVQEAARRAFEYRNAAVKARFDQLDIYVSQTPQKIEEDKKAIQGRRDDIEKPKEGKTEIDWYLDKARELQRESKALGMELPQEERERIVGEMKQAITKQKQARELVEAGLKQIESKAETSALSLTFEAQKTFPKRPDAKKPYSRELLAEATRSQTIAEQARNKAAAARSSTDDVPVLISDGLRMAKDAYDSVEKNLRARKAAAKAAIRGHKKTIDDAKALALSATTTIEAKNLKGRFLQLAGDETEYGEIPFELDFAKQKLREAGDERKEIIYPEEAELTQAKAAFQAAEQRLSTALKTAADAEERFNREIKPPIDGPLLARAQTIAQEVKNVGAEVNAALQEAQTALVEVERLNTRALTISDEATIAVGKFYEKRIAAAEAELKRHEDALSAAGREAKTVRQTLQQIRDVGKQITEEIGSIPEELSNDYDRIAEVVNAANKTVKANMDVEEEKEAILKASQTLADDPDAKDLNATIKTAEAAALKIASATDAINTAQKSLTNQQPPAQQLLTAFTQHHNLELEALKLGIQDAIDTARLSFGGVQNIKENAVKTATTTGAQRTRIYSQCTKALDEFPQFLEMKAIARIQRNLEQAEAVMAQALGELKNFPDAKQSESQCNDLLAKKPTQSVLQDANALATEAQRLKKKSVHIHSQVEAAKKLVAEAENEVANLLKIAQAAKEKAAAAEAQRARDYSKMTGPVPVMPVIPANVTKPSQLREKQPKLAAPAETPVIAPQAALGAGAGNTSAELKTKATVATTPASTASAEQRAAKLKRAKETEEAKKAKMVEQKDAVSAPTPVQEQLARSQARLQNPSAYDDSDLLDIEALAAWSAHDVNNPYLFENFKPKNVAPPPATHLPNLDRLTPATKGITWIAPQSITPPVAPAARITKNKGETPRHFNERKARETIQFDPTYLKNLHDKIKAKEPPSAGPTSTAVSDTRRDLQSRLDNAARTGKPLQPASQRERDTKVYGRASLGAGHHNNNTAPNHSPSVDAATNQPQNLQSGGSHSQRGMTKGSR